MATKLDSADCSQQEQLIRAIQHPAVFGPEVAQVHLVETHISYVLLTGRHAFKIRKAVKLAFLDFTTLAARRHDCEEELRLNRRLAPDIYLDVVAITGRVDAPQIGGNGPVLEYAVRMREFPQESLLSEVLARGGLTTAQIDALAQSIAAFHGSIAAVQTDGRFSRPEDVRRLAMANFSETRPLIEDVSERALLEALCMWTEREYGAQAPVMERRLRAGFVRECHGDLHTGNIALIDGQIAIFDCLEFNAAMRWMDTMSEIAFLVMDLQDRKRPDLAARLLNTYLEITGDYSGLNILRFYLGYRAMVRAKVACVRAAQLEPGSSKIALISEYRGYVDLAMSYVQSRRPALVITHGFAGSGKTTRSQTLLELIGAVRIRTDVERKRLHGIRSLDRSGSTLGGGLYTESATAETYRHVHALARGTLESGYVTIVDGTFLQRWQRDLFRDLAADLHLPFVILTFSADTARLRERVIHRSRDAHDASEASLDVLDHQLKTYKPLGAEERRFVVRYEAATGGDHERSALTWKPVIERLADSTPWIPVRAS